MPSDNAAMRAHMSAQHPGLDISHMDLVWALTRVMRLLGRAVEPVYDGAPLTAPEMDLLIPLRFSSEPLIARRLADTLDLSRAAVSKALSRLEARGHIVRIPNAADRREALITITDSGKAAMDALFPRQIAAEAALFDGLGDDRQHILAAVLRLLDGMERAASDSDVRARRPPLQEQKS